MLERPDGPALLRTAREVLLRDLLPLLPEASRFQARMVANAMAIAQREAAAETGPAEAALRDALDASADDTGALLTRLAAGIRAGRHDPGGASHTAVAAALVRLVRLRCGVSAPKSLARQETPHA